MIILKLDDLISDKPPQHEYELSGKTIVYDNPPLKAVPDMARVLMGDGSFKTIRTSAISFLKRATYKNDEFDMGWLDAISLESYRHFVRFANNPDNPGDASDNASPFVMEIRGHNVRFAPLTLGDLGFFADYLENNAETFIMAEYLIAQLDRLVETAVLEDGSPVPENLFDNLKQYEVEALVKFWVNRRVEEEKKEEETPKNGRRKKASTGKKQSQSSATTTDSVS